MIEVKSLVRQFGAFRAVDQIHFDIPDGQIVGFLGPNGAGKSTTMKMLSCYLEPTAGTATINGKDIRQQPLEVKKQIGYLPESCPLYGDMNVGEFLDFMGEVRGLPKAERETALERVKKTCDIAVVWHQSIDTLSKGYRQRVGFAQALLHDPPVLILDEPTDGLDPNQKHDMRQLIREMGANNVRSLLTADKLLPTVCPASCVKKLHHNASMIFLEK